MFNMMLNTITRNIIIHYMGKACIIYFKIRLSRNQDLFCLFSILPLTVHPCCRLLTTSRVCRYTIIIYIIGIYILKVCTPS